MLIHAHPPYIYISETIPCFTLYRIPPFTLPVTEFTLYRIPLHPDPLPNPTYPYRIPHTLYRIPLNPLPNPTLPFTRLTLDWRHMACTLTLKKTRGSPSSGPPGHHRLTLPHRHRTRFWGVHRRSGLVEFQPWREVWLGSPPEHPWIPCQTTAFDCGSPLSCCDSCNGGENASLGGTLD